MAYGGGPGPRVGIGDPEHDRERHEYEVQQQEQLHQARQVPGYKRRWRINWGQVIGWLILAAIFAGVVLLLWHVQKS
jgi:hypothetical protein